MAMDGTVKVPIAGAVKKKYAAGGVVILVVILGVAYYRHSKNASAANAAAAGAQDPNAIDPATGLPYAQEATGAGSGTGSADTSGIIGYDAQGNPIYADQVGRGATLSFVSNAAWAQAAEQYLVDTTGADAGTVAAALGVYLNGKTLSGAQASVVQSAIAFFGQPPNQGVGGYPPALRLGAPPGATVSVPNVVGKSAGQAHNAIVAAGLVPIADPGEKPTDKVTSTSPRGGTHVAHGSQVLITATPSGGGHHPPPHPGTKVKVPNVVGRTAGEAFNILEVRGGFEMIDPKAGRRGEPRRRVRGQSPHAGTEVSKGSRVTIDVR